MKKTCVNVAILAGVILFPALCFAQTGTPPGGIEGLEVANDTLIEWIAPTEKIIYSVAVIVGLIGGFRIAQKLFNGDRDVNKDMTNFGGACIFLVVVGLVLRGIFLG